MLAKLRKVKGGTLQSLDTASSPFAELCLGSVRGRGEPRDICHVLPSCLKTGFSGDFTPQPSASAGVGGFLHGFVVFLNTQSNHLFAINPSHV